MVNDKVGLIPDVGGFCSSNLKLIEEVYAEAERILPIFSKYNSANDFLEEALGYSVKDRIKEAYLVPRNHARLGAVNGMLDDDSISLLGPNATEKQIKEVVALLKTEKSDLEHDIKARLDDFADGSIQYSKKDLKNAMRAATAQQIQEAVPPHLIEKYREELDKFAAYLDEGAWHQSESGHVSLMRNEAGQFKTSDYVYKGVPIALGVALLGVLYQIFGAGAGGISKEVVHDSEVQYDDPVVAANDTPDNQDQIVRDENIPDWLIPKKNLLGNEYFEIDREKLPLTVPGLKLVEGNDDKFDDDVIDPDNGVAEMTTGFAVEGYALLIADQDLFDEHDGVMLQVEALVGTEERPLLITKEAGFTEVAPGMFAMPVPIQLSENSRFFVENPDNQELLITYKKILNQN